MPLDRETRMSRIARPIGRARIETSYTREISISGVGIARPIGRARIETQAAASGSTEPSCIARPIGRARIETQVTADSQLPTILHRPANRPGAD